MPYIKPQDRTKFDTLIRELREVIETEGEYNYVITSLLLPEDISYQKINTIVGILECVKLEFYRRAAATYEDQKIKDNTDVY